MYSKTRSLPAGSRLVGLLIGVALMLSLPSVALAAEQAGGTAPLAQGAGYATADGSAQVRTLQRRLQTLGEEPGPVDGLFGPVTDAAVRRLQARSGLAVDGLVGPATRKAVRQAQPRPVRVGAGIGVPGGSAQVHALQRRLRAAGESVGPIDGAYGPRTEAAVRHLQARRGLSVDGVAGPHTFAALERTGRTGTPAVPVDDDKERRGSGSADRRPQDRLPMPRRDGRRRGRYRTPRPETKGAACRGGPSPSASRLPAALIALLLIRGVPRRRPARSVVPLGRGLELEGTSSDTSIGKFRGTAYAVDIPAITDPGKRAEASRFFVLDPKRKLPFWVDYTDVDTPLPPALQAHPGPLTGGAELGPGTAVLGYVTVPKAVPERQAELYEQLAQIEGLCKRRRFELVGVVRDVEPNGDEVLDRPGIRYALEQFGAHRASALVVSDVRRLSVSRAQFDALLARLTAEEVALVALEPELDTSTDEGREVVRQLEIVRAERTKLAEAPPAPKPKPKPKPAAQRTTKAKAGRITGGGEQAPPAVKERIVEMRDRGESLKSIADALNEEGVPPPRGGPKWRPASVRKTLGKEGAEESNKVVRLKAAPVPEPDESGKETRQGQRAGGDRGRR